MAGKPVGAVLAGMGKEFKPDESYSFFVEPGAKNEKRVSIKVKKVCYEDDPSTSLPSSFCGWVEYAEKEKCLVQGEADSEVDRYYHLTADGRLWEALGII